MLWLEKLGIPRIGCCLHPAKSLTGCNIHLTCVCDLVCLQTKDRVSWLGSRPGQPQKIMSGLRETFKNRYLVEKISRGEYDQKSEKAERCRENLWNEIQLKGL